MTFTKPIQWVGSSLKDLQSFPPSVQRSAGFMLWKLQLGNTDPSIKPLTGDPAFRGAKVREIVEDHASDTYRTVVTVEHEEAVYVLHAFKKKSKSGRATPQADIERIKKRLKAVDAFRASPEGMALRRARSSP